MNYSTIDKRLYKVFIFVIKYIPITLLILFLIGFVINSFGISSFIIACFGGTSLLSIGFMYLSSYIFRFCELHRLPLHYVTLSNIITILNSCLKFINIIPLLRILIIVGGIILVYYIIRTYLDRNKPKPDYLQMFCERYCGC